MPAYCAVPPTQPPRPGVVVIHDFTGMSHDLHAQADWLAGEGFLAVAPDLYYWGSRLSCLRTIMRDLGSAGAGPSTTSTQPVGGCAATASAPEMLESSGSAWVAAMQSRWPRVEASMLPA
jgi:dienelactone hydrolase